MAIPTSTIIYGKRPSNLVNNTLNLKVKTNTGFKYPIDEFPKNGYFSKSTGLQLIRSNLKQLLLTGRGERFMLPNYGCNIRKFLMEPMDEGTFEEVREEITSSITTYLSNVSITKLQIFDADDSNLRIKLYCNLDSEQFISFDTDIEF